jgi:hypothetical protein
MKTAFDVKADYLGVIKLLISSGANPNRADFAGGTPLCCVVCACLAHCVPETFEIVKYLLENGAKVDVSPAFCMGKNLITFARERCVDETIVELLQKYEVLNG